MNDDRKIDVDPALAETLGEVFERAQKAVAEREEREAARRTAALEERRRELREQLGPTDSRH